MCNCNESTATVQPATAADFPEVPPVPEGVERIEIDIYEEGEPVETVEPSPEFAAFLAQRDVMLGVA